MTVKTAKEKKPTQALLIGILPPITHLIAVYLKIELLTQKLNVLKVSISYWDIAGWDIDIFSKVEFGFLLF